MDVDTSTADRQWATVHEWLSSPDARAAARSEIGRRALVGVDVDDVLAETSVRVGRTLRRRPEPIDEGADGRGLVRYARRVIGHVVIDALRASVRKEVPLDDLDLGADPDADLVPNGTADPALDLDILLGHRGAPAVPGGPSDDDRFPSSWLDDARRDLHAGLDRETLVGAAALMTLGVIADDLTVSDDVVQPERGATQSQAAGWAGLWFVGRRELFPSGADAAARQRRSRAVRAVAARIERAVEAVDGRG